jgi:hypothetical protein
MKRLAALTVISISTLAAVGVVAAVAETRSTHSTTTTTSRNVPWCTNTHIRVTVGRANGAAGTIYHPIIFSNRSSITCVISGVASLQPGNMGKDFVAVGPAATSDSMGMMGVLITLTPSQSASDDMGVIETGNFTLSTCRPANANAVLVRLGSISATVSVGPYSVCRARSSTTTRLLNRGTQG